MKFENQRKGVRRLYLEKYLLPSILSFSVILGSTHRFPIPMCFHWQIRSRSWQCLFPAGLCSAFVCICCCSFAFFWISTPDGSVFHHGLLVLSFDSRVTCRYTTRIWIYVCVWVGVRESVCVRECECIFVYTSEIQCTSYSHTKPLAIRLRFMWPSFTHNSLFCAESKYISSLGLSLRSQLLFEHLHFSLLLARQLYLFLVCLPGCHFAFAECLCQCYSGYI